MSKPLTEDNLHHHRLLLASLDDMRKVAVHLFTQLAEDLDAMHASQASGPDQVSQRKPLRQTGTTTPLET